MQSKTPRGPRVTLHVTEEIIKDAIPRDSSHCMIAEALKASYPDAKAVSVDLATIRFTDPRRGLRFTYLTPRLAQVQLVRFDKGNLPEPYSFQLRSPQVTRSGTKSPRKPATTEKEQERRVKAAATMQEAVSKSKLVNRKADTGTVSERVGGKTPPMQTTKDSDVPFSRRRAFGLRGLEY